MCRDSDGGEAKELPEHRHEEAGAWKGMGVVVADVGSRGEGLGGEEALARCRRMGRGPAVDGEVKRVEGVWVGKYEMDEEKMWGSAVESRNG